MAFKGAGRPGPAPSRLRRAVASLRRRWCCSSSRGVSSSPAPRGPARVHHVDKTRIFCHVMHVMYERTRSVVVTTLSTPSPTSDRTSLRCAYLCGGARALSNGAPFGRDDDDGTHYMSSRTSCTLKTSWVYVCRCVYVFTCVCVRSTYVCACACMRVRVMGVVGVVFARVPASSACS